ncbi:MAG: DUF433 domain-containing protein, partial [Cyanobacteria bacterium J06642_11]
EGATAEEIVEQYPSLQLADVYSVISYYLRRKTEVDAYLKIRQSLLLWHLPKKHQPQYPR